MKVEKAIKFACDFCGKDEDEAKVLVRGPRDVCICGECVDTSQAVISGKYDKPAKLSPAEEAAKRLAYESFNYTERS